MNDDFHNEPTDDAREFSGRQPTEIDIGLLLYLSRKSILLIILFFGLSYLGVRIYLRYAQPIYQSSSILQIVSDNQAQSILNVDDIYETDDISGEVELLRSKEFFHRVLSKLPLQVTYFTKGEFLTNENYTGSNYLMAIDSIKNQAAYGTNFFVNFPSPDRITVSYQSGTESFSETFSVYDPISTPLADLRVMSVSPRIKVSDNTQVQEDGLFFRINRIDDLVASYYPRLVVKLLNSSAKTVAITFSDNNPIKARDIASGIANEFQVYDKERKGESAKRILEFIDKRLSAVYQDLRNSEISLQEFKKSNQLSERDDFTLIYLDRIKALQDKIVQLELREKVFEDISGSINEEKDIDTYELLPLLNSVEFEHNLQQQVLILHELLTSKEKLFFEVKQQSVEVENYNYNIEIQKKLILNSVQRILERITSQRLIFEERMREVEAEFENVPSQEIAFARLRRVFDINEKFHTLLLEKRTEYSISEAGLVSDHRILERATAPKAYIYPARTASFISGGAIALMLSVILVAIRYLMHKEITTISEIGRLSRSNVSILGMIPRYKNDIPVSQLLVDKRPKSLIAESFRNVRTNLQFIAHDQQPRIVAVTSTVSGEGKTFVAINLGGIIAFSGKRVIILDLDMRKPKIHLGFNSTNEVGMSTLLIGKNTIEETVKRSDLENLSYITAGPIPPNPSELIISGKLDEILEDLKEQYDIIIMDNPPVGLVTDGIYCIQKADYPIYIFRSEYSKRSFVQNVDHLINDKKIRNLSVILNGVDMQRSGYGYNYGYGSGYGYGYGGYGYGYRYGYGQQYGYGYGSGYGYYDEANTPEPPFWKRIFQKKKKVKNDD